MKTFSPLFLLGALGVLSAAASDAVAVDTSQWKCESCPFEKAGSGATLELGAGAVSADSAKFGDSTGLQKKGGFLIAGGAARHRSEEGLFGNMVASDLGLDTRSIAAEVGQEGLYTLRLGYAEIPRHQSNGAMTPFLDAGSAVLSLPPGDATFRSADLSTQRKRLDAGVSWTGMENWTHRVEARHEVRDGTQRSAGAFATTAAQLVAPVDQVTDQIEVSTAYATRHWHATLAYQASLFRNGQESLTWPFVALTNNPDVPTLRGQLALAPSNQFHQVMATAGSQISPTVQASAELAIGRMTQDAAYLEPTLNSALVVTRPAPSLDGRVATLNASLRLSVAATDRLRLLLSAIRDERDNQTSSLDYPSVTTDLGVLGPPRSNQPYSFTQDRLKLSADYRGPGSLKTSVGAEQDKRERTLQEVQTTRETTTWGRISAMPVDSVSLALRFAHANRDASDYHSVVSIVAPQNPLLRKFNMAERKRNSGGLRADITPAENVNLGVGVDLASDHFTGSQIGLTESRSRSVGADVSVAISEQTQVHAFAHAERSRSNQAGSEPFAAPDWTGRSEDVSKVAGIGIKHVALKGKLEVRADLVGSRSRSELNVNAALPSAPFPNATTSLDSFKLAATYRWNDSLSVLADYGFERFDSRDWHLDGVAPSSVPNLFGFGEASPRYSVNVVRIALRHRF
ncbi:MAG: MtrB/PioB family decaheme-associated outer membrane protein [Burkholderiaceae bacterium]